MKKQGFTLIELLIVIAIIGILAAVLVPNLLNARKVAADRAAQAYGQNVFKAGTAYLAENTSALAASITSTCGPAVVFSTPGGSYSVAAPGSSVTSCTITNPTTTSIAVTVVSQNGQTYTAQ